jgi:hypothetical protein
VFGVFRGSRLLCSGGTVRMVLHCVVFDRLARFPRRLGCGYPRHVTNLTAGQKPPQCHLKARGRRAVNQVIILKG